MTKIPSGEERVESLQVTSKLETNEQYLERVQKIMQQDRLALLTELRDSGLLEEKDVSGEFLCDLVYRMPPQDGDTVTHTHVDYSARKGHNTLARAVKEFISNMDKVWIPPTE